jgi:hypothetical protein
LVTVTQAKRDRYRLHYSATTVFALSINFPHKPRIIAMRPGAASVEGNKYRDVQLAICVQGERYLAGSLDVCDVGQGRKCVLWGL